MPDEGTFHAPDRVFCLIGTDPTDYDVAHGLSAATTVGPRSDGLVQIDNAYAPDTHQAYVHRSHSGRYALVNSEEGYQNLRRFLFGNCRAEAALVGVRLPQWPDTVWQAEVRLSVRGPADRHARADERPLVPPAAAGRAARPTGRTTGRRPPGGDVPVQQSPAGRHGHHVRAAPADPVAAAP